ncbi:protein phosphatase regulator [Exophiala sideris]|uniref:Protein phosphatase regulator n=1 Tax=Exophiala sideris TaxID=1016849 RepID=A0ABR0J9N7_9EURO|nr:protein phosphatase regulator [Exophiala sideris]KAK5059150.1 protein phosphatase regulator [Exophiala sideris]KAK5182984.1 protein phosphatase regulator [Eurotiomycetes sp. CCFEE 6388]
MTTILQAPISGPSPFSSSPIHSSSYPDLSTLKDSAPYTQTPKQNSSYSRHNYARHYAESEISTAPSSPQLTYTTTSRRDSYASTPASSLSLEKDMLDEDDDMAFPAFGNSGVSNKQYQEPIEEEDASQIPSPITEESSISSKSTQDDQAIEDEPTRHVDYLSHEWKEEDIWLSWSYVSHRRGSLANGTRLENASWRSWVKAKNQLKTVSPETLNWLKDCDVTWLYGPLQTPKAIPPSFDKSSPPPSRLSHSSSFVSKKPILKKKSASAAILERDRSSFTLPDAPTPSECKHVLFDEEVRQVQAIDSEDDDKADDDDVGIDTDEDDDFGLMMAPSQRANVSNRATPRGSFSNESKTIVPLPSTTLKYRHDTPEPPEVPKGSFGLWNSGHKLSPSPSQETLRPSRPSQNFLIDDDPEVNDEPWQPQSSLRHDRSPYDDDDNNDNHPNMRRTESGMFMPYDENEEEAAMNSTLFGQAVYAVNTFKDIAHVVWNVGWNRR